MLKWKIFRYKTLAIGWLILMCFLFFLPGSALPQEDWLDKIYFDKWVHIGLFTVLVFLWRSSFDSKINNYNFILLFFVLVYGFIVELIQLYWISNRSFDLLDVLADITGGIFGILIWMGTYRKK